MEPEATRIYFTVLIAGIVFCLIVVVFLITIISYQKKSVTAYLERMKADLNLSEREKTRIAFDLHDELNSRLAAAKMIIDDFAALNNEAKIIANKASGIISNIMMIVRQLSNNLVPYALQREGIIISLSELVDFLFSNSSIHVIPEWKIKDEDITKGDEIHVYRIVQELLSNIIKHAQANRIDISIQKKKRTIEMRVADDGIGFNQKLVQKSGKGLGLRNILARVNVMKGSMYLTTEPGKGTVYLIELPAPH